GREPQEAVVHAFFICFQYVSLLTAYIYRRVVMVCLRYGVLTIFAVQMMYQLNNCKKLKARQCS
ncbi:hypothetical protein, partial [Limosilactobacillus avium]|uniref:hypothetical protein n=1 Tax=Limosilactobacillus avium TaxID=2991831 RepID=UPI0024B89D2C